VSFHIDQRIEIAPVNEGGTWRKAIVVNRHDADPATAGSVEQWWACSSVQSYGTCILPESAMRAADWEMPWESVRYTKEQATLSVVRSVIWDICNKHMKMKAEEAYAFSDSITIGLNEKIAELHDGVNADLKRRAGDAA
jgi:hypothetical protein